MVNSTVDRGSALFHFVMIKPSHYDDDGYPIQWLRSAIPSNTLACLNALAEDARRREVLGTGVEIRLHTYDETNRRVKPREIIHMIKREGGRCLIGLVGVQSNQFPRAVDLAQAFSRRQAAGLHRRLSHLRLHLHAAGTAGRHQSGAADGHFVLRRRGRGTPARRGAARRLQRQAQAALQLHERAAEPGRRAAAVPAAQARQAHRRATCRASISAAAAPISARSAPSSTCRDARAASAPSTIWKRSCARTTPKASSGSSSPTTISPATGIGSRCSTA